VTSTDNYDWDGNSRPDHNFQGRTIASRELSTQREEINSHAKSCWFTMTFNFTNGDQISLRNDQKEARTTNALHNYTLSGKDAGKYTAQQASGGDVNSFAIAGPFQAG
jgi:hypothetical protein